MTGGAGAGPVIVGFDGTRASVHALRGAAPLLAGHQVLVVVVWEAGRAFELASIPTVDPVPPQAGLDPGTAFEVDQAMYVQARRLAASGVTLAREAGLSARGLVLPDNATVAEILDRLARERDSPAVVVGAPNRNRLGELLLGSTARSLLHRAACPVVVVREEATDDRGD